MRIPDHIIDQVREQSNIVDVIGEHVRLKKTGRNYTGLCPFHNEKTPSFHVNPERGIYKCFGCGKAGNAITFVTEFQHMGFVDAVKHLAQKLGIQIPEEHIDDPTGIYARKDAAFRVLAAVADHYATHLTASDGAPARSYFTSRGFSDATILGWTLGASPASWDATMSFLKTNGYTDEHLSDAGLIVVREDGRMYDRFRGRAMFTIRDDVGRVVGFSARILTDDPQQPKYINSPQSLVFDKSRVLYGLDKAKRPIAEKRLAVLVEGQADVVTMHQAGFTHAVASSGTALTLEHVQLLRKYADTIVLVFDADNAGQNATTKAIELALSIGLDVRVVVLPSGTDPDSLVRTQGAPAMQALLDAAMSFLQFQYERFQNQGLLDNSLQQAKAVRTLLQWIAGVPDSLRHPFLIRELADRFRLQESHLLGELQQISPTSAPKTRTPSIVAPPQERTDIVRAMILPSERELLRVALVAEHGLALLMNQYRVTEDSFWSDCGRKMFRRIQYAAEEHSDIIKSVLDDDALSEAERRELADIVFTTNEVSLKWQSFEVEIPLLDYSRNVRDALVHLKMHRLQAEINELTAGIGSIPDIDEAGRVLYRVQELTAQREALRRVLNEDPETSQWLDAGIV
ncbi:DNA primase [soil metagenome]